MYKISRHPDNKSIVIVDLSGEYTIDDVRCVNDEVVEIANTSDAIYLIIDTLKITKFPQEIAKMSKLSKPIGDAKSIVGITIVNKNSLIKFISGMVTAIFRQKYTVTESHDVAMQNAMDKLATV